MPEDELPVSGVLAASYPALMRPSYDAEVLAAALPLMTRANSSLLAAGTFYVAEVADGSLAGCGGWSLQRPENNEVEAGLAHLRHFASHADWLGRGIGRAIYARCEDAAGRRGVRRLQCYASLNAEGFYAALGFVSVGEIAVAMGAGLTLPSILMKRSI